MNKTLKMFERIGLGCAGVFLLTIMFMVSADAAARYLLGHPIGWSVELIGYYLMVVVAYFGASETLRCGDHIQLDLFLDRMSPRTRIWTTLFHTILAAMVFAIISYGSALSMIEAYVNHEHIHGYIAWPVWPSFLPIVMGCILLSLRMVHQCVMLISHGEVPAIQLQEEI